MCATGAFSTTFAIHVEACVCLVAQWQSTGSSSQVYSPVTALHFLLFCLITGKFTVKCLVTTLCVVTEYILWNTFNCNVQWLASSPGPFKKSDFSNGPGDEAS